MSGQDSKRKRQPSSLSTDSNMISISQEDLDSLIKEAVNAASNVIIARMTVLLNEKCKEIEDRTNGELMDMKTKYENLVKENETLKGMNATNETNIKTNSSRSNQGIILANDCEQYTRRWSVRVYGIAELDDEDCTKLVVDVFKNNLGLSLNATHIEAAHRVGKTRVLEDGKVIPKAIICRFCDRRDRDRVMTNRKKLKGKKIAIADDLTTLNYKLLNRVKNHTKFQDSWAWNGRVFGKLVSGKIYKISLFQDFDALK